MIDKVRKAVNSENNSVYKQKKIMFYIDTMYRGGAQRVMSVLVHSFVEKGYEVALINDFKDQDNNNTYQISPEVKRLYLNDSNTGNPMVKNITRIKELRKIIKAEHPDVILSFLGRPNQRVLIAASGLKVKKVVSVRNDPNREYGTGKIKKAWINHLFKRADGIVFQTEEAKQYFSDKIQENSIVILNPVDSKFYNIKRGVEPKNIVAVGRLEEQKNHRLLINAFAEIAHDYPDEKLVIFGEGPLRGDLENLISKLKLSSLVELRGNVENIEQALADAKLFVMTSDYEGLPNALMEAMVVGVPCVSTDCPCGGPRELIEDNISGMLVPCGDKAALVKKMRILLSDKAICTDFEEQSKTKAEEFRTEKVIAEWEQFLTL